MGHDPARAVTVGALALLLLVTATLFPTGGFGSYPAADGVDPGERDLGPELPTETAPPPEVTTETATGQPTVTPASTATETPTETPTATPTATETPIPDEDDTDPALLGGLLGGLSAALWWLFLAAIVTFAGGILALAGSITANADVPDGRLPRVSVFFAAIPRATVAVLVGSGSIFATVGGVASGTLGTVTTGSVRGVAEVVGAFGTVVGSVGHALGSISAPSLGNLVSGVSVSRSRRGSSDRQSRSATAEKSTEMNSDDTVSPPETVAEAWARFPAHVPGLRSRPETRTPGELARRAVAGGLPRDAVETLTAAFRRVRYADGVADRRESAALDAFDRLRGSEEDSAGTDDSDTDGGDAS